MTDEQKIAFVDALCAHFVATLDPYYTEGIPTDPRYDSGAAEQGETRVRELAIEDGWLLIGLLINGWADQQDFIIELPTITRDAAA